MKKSDLLAFGEIMEVMGREMPKLAENEVVRERVKALVTFLSSPFSFVASSHCKGDIPSAPDAWALDELGTIALADGKTYYQEHGAKWPFHLPFFELTKASTTTGTTLLYWGLILWFSLGRGSIIQTN